MAARAEIQKIKERNAKVEADKAWELSYARRGIITIALYFTVVIFLILIEAPNPYGNAIVPAVGYIFSTLTLPFAKEWWLEKVYRKR